MAIAIIFKVFRTLRYPYLYDRHTNSLVRLTDDEFDELKAVQSGTLAYEHSSVIRKYQSFGLLKPNTVQRIEHSASQIIEQFLRTRLHQLTLQVTQQCNLRCGYCAYSGIYSHTRTHSSLRMSWDTAKKAIDFFLARNSSLNHVYISFYGGEPLLEFGLIKKCVEYAKAQTEGKIITFSMTTNGTLLTDETVDYLAANDFSISISLDGSQPEHDANRKFANGKGSFSAIMDNIMRIRLRHPEFDKKIMIMTTINPHMDLGCVLEYFSTDDIFSDRHIMFNSMKETDLSEKLSYDQKYYMVRNYEYIKVLFSLTGKLDDKYVSRLTSGVKNEIRKRQLELKTRTPLGAAAHHNGPCLPGIKRLFVRVDGALYPCERVSEQLDYFKIGTLDTGFSIDSIKRLLNIGQVTADECRSCWNLRQCSICSGELEFDNYPAKQNKIPACRKNHSNTMFSLYEMCVLNEFGFNVNNDEV